MSNSSWYHDAQFDHFWQHYRAVRQWIERHDAVVNQLHQPNMVPIKMPTTARNSTSTTTTVSVDRKRKHEIDVDDVEVDDDELVVANDDENPLAMSDEMIAFFRKTIEHRLQRDKEREKAAKVDDNLMAQQPIDEYISADRIGVDGPLTANFDAPDELRMQTERRQRARDLYGESASTKILAMEMLTQMRFDEHRRRTDAPLWPNIPLNL